MDRKIDEVIDVLAPNDYHVSPPSGVPGAAAHAGAQAAGNVVARTFSAAPCRLWKGLIPCIWGICIIFMKKPAGFPGIYWASIHLTSPV